MVIARALFLLSAFFIVIYIYRVPVGPFNLTLSHLTQIAGLFLFVLILLNTYKVSISKKTCKAFLFAGLFIAYSGGNAVLLTKTKGAGVAFDALMLEMVGLVYVLFLPLIFNNFYSFNLLYRAFYLSAFFALVFSAYTLYVYIKTGQIVAGVPFGLSVYNDSTIASELKTPAQFHGFPRFRYPHVKSSALGIFLGIAGIFIISEFLRARKKIILLFFALTVFCLLGSLSRTGWIILFVGVVSQIMLLRRNRLICLARELPYFSFCFIAVIVAILAVPEFFKMIVGQLSLEQNVISNTRHLFVRIAALKEFVSSPVFGIGIGNFQALGYAATAHSTYITFLTERGVVGVSLYLSFLLCVFRAVKEKVDLVPCEDRKNKVVGIALLSALVGIVVGHVFYHFDQEFVWLLYALILSYANIPLRLEDRRVSAQVSHLPGTRAFQ